MSPDARVNNKAAEAIWQNLRDYADDWDRAAPAVFAGREAEIKTLAARVHRVASPKNPAGATTIIQGVPGVGKTALASEFAKRMHGKAMRDGAVVLTDAEWPDEDALSEDGPPENLKIVLCLNLGASELGESPKDFVSGMHNEILESLTEASKCNAQARGLMQYHIKRIGDLAARLFDRRTDAESKAAEYDLNRESSMRKCLSAYRKAWGDDLVLVILIDEAQTIPLSDRARSALQDLHASHHGCRIVPVLLGLSDTECHVMERDPQKGLGLSRLGLHAVKTIGCLNPAQGNEPSESRQAITGTLKALGMDWAEPGWRDILRDAGCDRNKWTQWRDALVEQLEEDSADFPQHITAGLIAVCEVLHANQNQLTMGQDLRHQIAAQQQVHKDGYYKNRLAGDTEPYAAAFGALCEVEAREGRSISEHEALAALDICRERSARASHTDSPSTLAVLDAAISKGILQREDDQYYCNKIPSLASYMRHWYQHKLETGDPAAATLRDTFKLEGDWTDGGGGPK